MTTNRTQPPSVAATFATTELLELILLRLPITDTIVATRVCRYWRRVIERSPAIRKRVLDPATPVFTKLPKQRLRGESIIGSGGRPAQATILLDPTNVRVRSVRTCFVMKVDKGHVLVYKESGRDAVFLFAPDEWQRDNRQMPLMVLGGCLKGDMTGLAFGFGGSVQWYKDSVGKDVICEKVFANGLANTSVRRVRGDKDWYEMVFFRNHYGSWKDKSEC